VIEEVDFSPANDPPTLKRFAYSDSLFRVVVGPVGSGKSTRCNREFGRRALRQKRGPDGVRRTRFAVIRNTYGQLRDTTRKTFEQWIPAWMGKWHEQSFTFHMRFDDVDSEILFRSLDRPEDVRKLLSLELTGAYVNEIREIPQQIVDVLETRIGRYPSRAQGGATWRGIWADTNPWHGGHWGAKRFAKGLPGHALFRQPGGRSPNAENLENLEPGYYDRLIVGKDREWVRVYVDGEDADSDVGAIFGAWMADLDDQGAICAFDHPTDRVYTSWDLGRADATAIWWWRVDGSGNVQILDHYENAGQGLSHFFDVVDGKSYPAAKVLLPHDSKIKTLATQRSVIEQCVDHWGMERVGRTPELSLQDGIAAARWLLEQPIQFHERCDVPGRFEHSGVDALREYRRKWDEEAQCFSNEPLHNWASHTADAFRYVACAVKAAQEHAKPEEKKPQTPIVDQGVTLDTAWADFDREQER
jgi:hypothetical protein